MMLLGVFLVLKFFFSVGLVQVVVLVLVSSVYCKVVKLFRFMNWVFFLMVLVIFLQGSLGRMCVSLQLLCEMSVILVLLVVVWVMVVRCVVLLFVKCRWLVSVVLLILILCFRFLRWVILCLNVVLLCIVLDGEQIQMWFM